MLTTPKARANSFLRGGGQDLCEELLIFRPFPYLPLHCDQKLMDILIYRVGHRMNQSPLQRRTVNKWPQ